MRRVVILKRYDREFRIPLYDLLGARLKNDGIQLEIYYGQPDRTEQKTIKDLISPNQWGKPVRNQYMPLGRSSLCWQPVLKYTRGADLVIVQQGNRLLINYLLQILRLFRRRPVLAFWGHGMNFQAHNHKSPIERFKALYSNHVDYWFAYNSLSKDLMVERGFDPERITSLENTIDSREEARLYEGIPGTQLAEIRQQLGIKEKDVVGIYCGSLYPEKRLDFLIDSLKKVRGKLSNLHFIIVGDGILRSQVEDWIRGEEDWIHLVGPRFGEEKLRYFRLAQFQLIPGLVGLNIIDSFITLTPLITTRNRLHSPEISYLENFRNGIMTDNTLDAYSEAILSFVRDPEIQRRMQEGCRIARETYTIENMADNYYKGVQRALNLNKSKGK